MSDFDNLINDLDALQELRKASGDELDVEAINAAAEEGEESEEEGEKEEMTKSIDLADGTSLEYLDGADLVKSLYARIDQQSTDVSRVLKATTDLLKSQSEEISALRSAVNTLAGTGRGRRSVASVETDLVKSEQAAGIDPDTFMTKALAAQKAGKLSALQVSIAEGSLQRGIDVPDSIKQVVFEG